MASDDTAQIEAAIRAAAKAAARGVPLGEGYLSKIVAETNRPGLSSADRVARAANMAEQYATSEKPINYLAATPKEIEAAQIASHFSGHRGSTTSSVLKNSDGDAGRASNVRRSSGDYEKIAGLDRGTYAALSSEGLNRQQINDASHAAQFLGWNDKDSIRNLANAGMPFATLAERYEQARRDGDAAKAVTLMDQMREQRDHAKGKQKMGMSGIIDKFEQLNAKSDNKAVHLSEADQTKRAAANPSDAAAAKQLFDLVRAKRPAP